MPSKNVTWGLLFWLGIALSLLPTPAISWSDTGHRVTCELAFEQLQFSMERMDDRLTQKDKKLEEDILSVTELFESFKRKTNRDLRQVKNDIKSISGDIEDLIFFTKRIPEKYLLDEQEVRDQEAKNNQ